MFDRVRHSYIFFPFSCCCFDHFFFLCSVLWFLCFIIARAQVDVCVFFVSFSLFFAPPLLVSLSLALSRSSWQISAEFYRTSSTATHSQFHISTLTYIPKDFSIFFVVFFYFEFIHRMLVPVPYLRSHRCVERRRMNERERDTHTYGESTSKHLPILWDHFYFIIFSWFTIIIFCAVYLALAHLWLFSSFTRIRNVRDDMTHTHDRRDFKKNEIVHAAVYVPGNRRRVVEAVAANSSETVLGPTRTERERTTVQREKKEKKKKEEGY